MLADDSAGNDTINAAISNTEKYQMLHSAIRFHAMTFCFSVMPALLVTRRRPRNDKRGNSTKLSKIKSCSPIK